MFSEVIFLLFSYLYVSLFQFLILFLKNMLQFLFSPGKSKNLLLDKDIVCYILEFDIYYFISFLLIILFVILWVMSFMSLVCKDS